ncbi:MAG: V-type ATP synthase subunit F [Eubacteriales bacterium]
MKKIGVIGDKDSVLGFMAAGFSVFVTEEPAQAVSIIEHAVKDGFAVLYITENLLAQIPDTYEKFKTEPMLAVIPIPSKTGSLGIGMANIKKSVERAVGADILKD